jgi:hypothetical protein
MLGTGRGVLLVGSRLIMGVAPVLAIEPDAAVGERSALAHEPA